MNKVVLVGVGINIALFAALRYRNGVESIRVQYELAGPTIEKSSTHVDEHMSEAHHLIYNYSLIPGGVANVDDFCEQIQNEPAFAGFNCNTANEFKLHSDIRVFMTFKKNGVIYWTKAPVLVKAGERVYTDGQRSFLARCANEIRFVPQMPSLEIEESEITVPTVAPVEAPPVIEPSAPAIAATSTVQQSSHKSGWAVIAAVPVIIWHGGGSDHSVKIPPRRPCDMNEIGYACAQY